MDKPLRKRRHQTTDVDLREASKKKRMMETEDRLEKSETSVSPKSSSGSRDNSLKKSGSGRHRSSQSKSFSADKALPANEKQSSLERSQSIMNSKTTLKVVHSSQSVDPHSSRPKSLSGDKAPPAKSEKKISLERSPFKNFKTDMKDINLSQSEHHHSSQSESFCPISSPSKSSQLRSESGHHNSSRKSVNADTVSPAKSEKQTSLERSIQSLYHSKTDLKDNRLFELGSSKDSGNKTFSEETFCKIFEQKCDNQFFKEVPPVVKKTSPVKKGFDDSDTEPATSDEDDPTVLLDQLKKEHKNCIVKIENLKKTNEKLTQKLEYQLAKNERTEMKLLQEISELKAANSSLQMKLKKTVSGYRGSSPAFSEDGVSSVLSFPRCATSPVAMTKSSSDAIFGSPWSSSPTSAVKENRGKHEGLNLKSVSKQLFKENENLDTKKNGLLDSPCGGSLSESSITPEKRDRFTTGLKVKMDSKHPLKKEVKSTDSRGKRNVSISKADEDEFGSGLDGVSKRIEADLRGIKPLQGDEKKVNVGMGLQISRNSWEKSIRLKRDDSKFLKDSAGIIWGREALQARTGFRQTGSKKACTPKKVNLLHAMLKGKMNARDEDPKQQNFILQNMAPKWLTAKCYDSGRKPKSTNDQQAS